MEVHPLIFKLFKALRLHLQRDQHYLLAVSGGSDSMALLSACLELAKKGWGTYSVCHVEHGLRGSEALRDMEFVESFCKKHGVRCLAYHVDVQEYAFEKRLSIEAAARKLRHSCLQRAMLEMKAHTVVFAHNKDDQAETVLLRLLRGSSITGLGGIRGRSDIGLHPLLAFTHAQLAKCCQLMGVEYCHDSTNDELVYTRNRVRHELIPYLEQHFNSNIKETLVRTASLLQEENAYLEQMALELYHQALISNATTRYMLTFQEDVLAEAPAALRRRVLREAYYKISMQELDYERTLAVEQLLLNRTGGKFVQLPKDIIVTYKNKRIIFENK
ncbi:MAG: tRNA lysidine(34) synthetase TilS [Phascolarctobacterium sp.]|nr:tRNA lysidine(34) synthetase TilS [Phascolarctobacterium sp.]